MLMIMFGRSPHNEYVSHRVFSSTYNDVVHAGQYMNVKGALLNSETTTYWNQMSDQAVPKGGGVDVKHGSYARYLNKKKGRVLRNRLCPCV